MNKIGEFSMPSFVLMKCLFQNEQPNETDAKKLNRRANLVSHYVTYVNSNCIKHDVRKNKQT